ncbi:hypothetical protein FOIG_13655 [Fusarium odoratissimum NRRL 54006]|uniref:Xylanolytic transcriptional activator regulatory domain-containing protein n=2 Tax=Fusarium oxysporum species complex TaxID=171631 RepID=X0JA58_FUSO5|nr:uncharacterized protein FOIG_13655 [Fusarium odoratissimum NRRL 54006]EXL93241.1 hypothetical protein FOIG_13655 [Fusarium odoratissimum NRRL 54006]
MATSLQTPRQRRPTKIRSLRACLVRCDALSKGIPCTNCTAFNIKCQVPGIGEHRVRILASRGKGEHTIAQRDSPSDCLSTPASSTEAYQITSQQDGVVSLTKFNVLPITSAGHVVYIGESAGFNLLLHGSQRPIVHFPMPRDTLVLSIPPGLDPLEIRILKRRRAFVLPPKRLCDDLIETYFAWVHPIVPVINRTKFMSQYRDSKNPPSMLLTQCILLAGARISTNSQLMVDGSASTAVATFYRRAKALYDANYERDRITLVQSMLLMGWYWAGPDDISKNMFYWSQSAIAVAQNFGLHRSMEKSRLSISEKRLRKRIWWTLFTRDRALAVGLGQSVSINLDDCDVDMIADDDFIEHDGDDIDEYPPDPIHVGFFIHPIQMEAGVPRYHALGAIKAPFLVWDTILALLQRSLSATSGKFPS